LLQKGYDEETCEKRALGYGNHGLLVAFPYNVPAHTVTAIWERGDLGVDKWNALLPRRRKA
jgi:hypothetical protein